MYTITILDCLNAVKKAKEAGFFDFDDFDCEEYEHYEKVQIFSKNYHYKKYFEPFLCFIQVVDLMERNL